MNNCKSFRRPGALLAIITIIAAIACSTASPSTATAIPEWLPAGAITRSQAIETAFARIDTVGPGVTAVTGPRNPVAELVIYTQGGDTKPIASELLAGERYAWVVQIEGESQSVPVTVGEEVSEYKYAVVYIDAMTNSFFKGVRDFEPYFQ